MGLYPRLRHFQEAIDDAQGRPGLTIYGMGSRGAREIRFAIAPDAAL
jgi:hypothetical protein